MAWLFLQTTTARGSSFLVDDWTLITAILDNSSGEPVITGASFTEVANPFMDAHGGSFPPPSASATSAAYDFVWNELLGTGSFDITTAQTLEGVGTSNAFVVTEGSIFVHPTVPLILNGSTNYTFTLPDDPMLTTIAFSVINDNDSTDRPFGENGIHDTTFDGIGTHALSINAEDIILPANETWRISYFMRTIVFDDTSSFLAAADGFVHFDLHPVPEPTTLLLLFWVALLLRRTPTRCLKTQ